jgi:hypothetical protein
LSLLHCGALLCEYEAIGVQTLGKHRIVLQESGETRLEGMHERWFRGGFLPLIGQCRQVVLKVSEVLLAFEHEPFQIG